MNQSQLIEVGKALLPYLRGDLSAQELGAAAHNAAAALSRSPGLTELQRLAITCGNEPYADAKVCPACKGFGHVSSI